MTLPAALTAEEKALRSDIYANFFIVEPDGEQLSQIAQLCESGAVKPVLRAVLPLDEGAKAFEMLAEGHSAGKIVLKVTQKE